MIRFAWAAIAPLLAHAEAAPSQSPSYTQRTDPRYWKPGAIPDEDGAAEVEDMDVAKLPPALWFVKDDGCYLLSAGVPLQLEPGTDNRLVVYAEGLDRTADYDHIREVGGGNDFVEVLTTDEIRQLVAPEESPKAFCIQFIGVDFGQMEMWVE